MNITSLVWKLLLVFLLPLSVVAQVLPAEGGKLNYRIIGFSFSGIAAGTQGRLEVAEGHYNSIDSFRNNIVVTQKCEKSRVVAEVPLFGKDYTWRVTYPGANTSQEALHHFSTLKIPNVDTAHMRLRVLQQAKKYNDAYVFVDGNRVLYDMKGNAVWFLPDNFGEFEHMKKELRDMKVSPQGTITFLIGTSIYDMDYNGNVLWKGPDRGMVSGGAFEGYHHEMTRLPNGHYMVLGEENSLLDVNEAKNGKLVLKSGRENLSDSAKKNFIKVGISTVIEYDGKNNIVWSWKASSWLPGSDLIYYIEKTSPPALSLHENSFFFDSKEKVVYLGIRNISRILKIKYPEGTVLASYGETYKPGVPEEGNGLFCRQHCCRKSANGDLYLFDNHYCTAHTMPKLIVMEQPKDGTGTLKEKWEYTCTIDSPAAKIDYSFPMGGGVIELPDRSFFSCMGSIYSKVFIVNRDKEILWSALPEVWNERAKAWGVNYSYRASILTTKEDLEHLIWGEKLETQ